MIVTRRGGALSLVEQVEHGRVAGALAGRWGNLSFAAPSPHGPVCLAARRHDDGWRAWDARVLFNELERRPQHFLEIDPSEHVRLYRSGVEQVTLGDVYAGVLVGMHWTGLYRGRWSSPGARGRLTRGSGALLNEVVRAEQTRWIDAKEQAWREDEPRSAFETRLWHNYDLLQAWDLLSLHLCVMPADPSAPSTGADDPPEPWGPQLASLEHRPQRVRLPMVRADAFGPTKSITVEVIAPGVAVLEPFPFADSGFQVHVSHRMIPDRAYTATESTAAFRKAPPAVITWTVQARHRHE